MYRKIAVVGFAAIVSLGCGNRSEAKDIRDQLRDDDYRENYARAPGWPSPLLPAAGGPHGNFVDIYVNDVIEEAIESGEALERWPEGALIVKDGYDDAEGNDYEYLAFMERRSDGWFWGEFRGNGRFVSAGLDDRTCAGCHSSGEDSVRAFGFPPYE